MVWFTCTCCAFCGSELSLTANCHLETVDLCITLHLGYANLSKHQDSKGLKNWDWPVPHVHHIDAFGLGILQV